MVYKKKRINYSKFAIVHIKIASRNTIISVSNKLGDIFCWASTGTMGYTGPKKKSLIATLSVAKNIVEQIEIKKIKQIFVIIKGPIENTNDILQIFRQSNLQIISIKNLILIPHNGCRPPKKRKL